MNSSSYLQNQVYRDEVEDSIYWQHRGQFHRKLLDRDDHAAVQRAIDQAASKVSEANAILFVTGAGIGVDMGLADFRSSQTFWSSLNHPDISRYEDFSDTKWFKDDPSLAWGINMYQISSYRSAEPHDGYTAMLELAHLKQDYFCYTSNIDGVLQRVGFDSKRVREVHGNIHRLQCQRYSCKNSNGNCDVWNEILNIDYDLHTYRASGPYPRCSNCLSDARPNVWFCHDGDYVLSEESSQISSDYRQWIERLENDSDKTVCVIEIGCGLVIPSGRIEAELTCEQLPNATLIRINPVDYMVPSGPDNAYNAFGIPLGGKAGMTRILESVKQMSS